MNPSGNLSYISVAGILEATIIRQLRDLNLTSTMESFKRFNNCRGGELHLFIIAKTSSHMHRFFFHTGTCQLVSDLMRGARV